MCLDIIKNPAKSIMDAKKRGSMKKTGLVVIETAVLFALSAGIPAAAVMTGVLLLGLIVSVFLISVIAMLLLGLILNVSATTLGGKGKYFEGLTAAAYSFNPPSIGIFIASLLTFVPLSAGIQIIALAVSFALGLSLLYRSVKELYRTDMITAFIVVLIAVAAIFAAVYFTLGLSMIGRMPLAV